VREEYKMKKGLKNTRLAILAALAALACALSCATSGELVHPYSVVFEQSGMKALLEQGKTFEVRLERQAGTGYSWEIAGHNDCIAPEGKPTVEKPEKPAGRPGIAGGKEYQVFRFTAVKPGRGTLEIRFARPWEKGVEPAKRFVLNYEVIPPAESSPR